jgi:hypothetical protein
MHETCTIDKRHPPRDYKALVAAADDDVRIKKRNSRSLARQNTRARGRDN